MNYCNICEFYDECEYAGIINFCDSCKDCNVCSIKTVYCTKGYAIECDNGFEDINDYCSEDYEEGAE